jgi:flavin reductase (DIM6/NTAB) family NADH-FMN oxidoreductase RutF
MGLDASAYRQIIGHFATGITVVTTAHEGRLHAITANALTSVSLNPLLLLVCVDKEAHAHAELERSGRFAVNVLSEEQEELSRLFATKAEPEAGSLRGAPFHLSVSGLPLLDGCLAYLECEVADRCVGGDHTIFIGSVVDGEVVSEEPPLLYFRGGYRRIAR